MTVGEVDVVGHPWQALGHPLPAGVKLIRRRTVDDFLVDRFSIAPARRLTTAQVRALAGQLLGPPLSGAAVLSQSPSSAR